MITLFYLPPTHEPYLPLLPSRKASLPFGWYSLCLPMKGWPGWVNLGGWSHTEINVPNRELNADTVIHLSANRARRWLTLLIEANAQIMDPISYCKQITKLLPTISSLNVFRSSMTLLLKEYSPMYNLTFLFANCNECHLKFDQYFV